MGKVFGLLLGFATLPEKSRRDFLTKLNEFIMMSPSQKRRVIVEWQHAADDGSGESDKSVIKR
ncbi:MULTISPECIES: hypothetical protein [unclassified Burkholderia]|uniref:hypothetical protein n=1 Tax=unclassified Burkholderia TaxID=2613784 RepID=UPI000A069E09|nr:MULTISPECIES: hypothetical protein [unclassified Burkholderia]RQU14933.1 hypothetical protein DF152_16335 [Burkholderia cenocepacia]MBR8235220.1 hypothetical protein [Burkholderia sp. AU32357]MBY4873880.1 hypothetical protein [Burkholderia sp. AU42008]OXI39878.1 hypothetical protein CFB49_17265 [Burkholderia sp. AU17457]OXI66385.1 hypothetical protein CFB81_16575 [Burkholderia sp. AU28863]